MGSSRQSKFHTGLEKATPGQSRHRSSEDFGDIFDGFIKSPSAALRFNFVVAEGRGGSPSRPISDLRALRCRGEWRSPENGRPPDAPTILTIVLATSYEITMYSLVRKFHPESGTGPNEWKYTKSARTRQEPERLQIRFPESGKIGLGLRFETKREDSGRDQKF